MNDFRARGIAISVAGLYFLGIGIVGLVGVSVPLGAVMLVVAGWFFGVAAMYFDPPFDR